MNALARAREWVWLIRHQPLTVRLMAGAAGLLAVVGTFAAPAGADSTDDNFIDALNHAGVNFGEPGNAMAVGQSICPMLATPGGTFAAAAAGVAHKGMSPRMAQTFTIIAIQMYCPQDLASLASGTLPSLPAGTTPAPKTYGLPAIPGT
jgi:hypothetical protein